jgi:hypothetical protein
MDFSVIQALGKDPVYANSKNEYQVNFVPTSATAVQAESNEILTKTIVIQFYPNSDDIDKKVDKAVNGKTVRRPTIRTRHSSSRRPASSPANSARRASSSRATPTRR